MKSDSLTIKDIAKELGISFSTVARALKDNYSISEATRNRVKAFAERHNYKPNLGAQGLKNKRTRSIGVSLSSIPNNFYAEVLNGMESVASTNNYQIIITQSLESFQREVKNIELLTSRAVDGILISLSPNLESINHLHKLQSNGTPIVFFDRVSEHIKTHKVVSDNVQGAYDATMHLIESGYKRIAHVTSATDLSITKERLDGYKKAMLEKNIKIDNSLIRYCPHGGMIREEIKTAIISMLEKNPPDAILTASDRITIGCFSVLKQEGVKIPEDIGLAGFSNFSSPELFCPALTTVTQPAFEMGKVAMELLIKLIETKRPVTVFEKRVLPTELVIRDTSIMNRPKNR